VGSLQVQRLDVLPSLLQERDQKVGGQHDVGKEVVLGEGDVSDGNGEAENLLQLESDGASQLVDLDVHVIVVGHQERELSGLVESRAEETRDLTDNSLRGKEGVVLGSKLLDQLLVLVQLLQVIDGQKVKSKLLSLVTVELVSQDADAVLGLGDGGELDRSRETLVLLRVVVLQSNLELEGLSETTGLGLSLSVGLGWLGSSLLLSLGSRGEEGIDVFSQLFARYLTHCVF